MKYKKNILFLKDEQKMGILVVWYADVFFFLKIKIIIYKYGANKKQLIYVNNYLQNIITKKKIIY